MVFLAEDAWYLMLGKGIVLILALIIFFRLIKLSLWNCSSRITDTFLNRSDTNLFGLVKQISAILINVAFLWLLTQGVVILVMGCVGIAPMQLMAWRFQEITLIGVTVWALVYAYRHKRHISEFK
jgi:hypothetical protein